MLVPSADLVVFFFPKKIIPLVAPFPFSSVLLIPSQGMKEGVQGSGLIPPELAAVKLSAGGRPLLSSGALCMAVFARERAAFLFHRPWINMQVGPSGLHLNLSGGAGDGASCSSFFLPDTEVNKNEWPPVDPGWQSDLLVCTSSNRTLGFEKAATGDESEQSSCLKMDAGATARLRPPPFHPAATAHLPSPFLFSDVAPLKTTDNFSNFTTPGSDWLAGACFFLTGTPNVRITRRAGVFGFRTSRTRCRNEIQRRRRVWRGYLQAGQLWSAILHAETDWVLN